MAENPAISPLTIAVLTGLCQETLKGSQEEYLTILKNSSLFSCVSIRNGEKLNNFSYGYVIQETAEDYDLLIYKNEEC